MSLEAVERAVWQELSKRRWFGKYVEDEEMESLESDLHTAILEATKAIVLVSNDEGDWMGVYVGNDLVYQGHSIEPSRLLEIIGVSHTNYRDYSMGDDSHLPRTRDELKGFGG